MVEYLDFSLLIFYLLFLLLLSVILWRHVLRRLRVNRYYTVLAKQAQVSCPRYVRECFVSSYEHVLRAKVLASVKAGDDLINVFFAAADQRSAWFEKLLAKRFPRVESLLLGGLFYAENKNAQKLGYILRRLRFVRLWGLNRAVYFYLKGRASALQGDFSKAVDGYLKAQKIFLSAKQWYEVGRISYELGEIYRLCKYFDNAFSAYDAAAQYYGKVGYDFGVLMAQFGKGQVFNLICRYDEALAYFKACLKGFDKLKDLVGRGKCLNQMALSYVGLEQYSKAKRNLDQVFKLHLDRQDLSLYADGLNISAYLNFKRQQYQKGIAFADRAIKAYAALSNQVDVLNMMYLKANMLFSSKKYVLADRVCKKISDRYIDFYVFFSKAEVFSLRAQIRFAQKKYLSALKFYEQSLQEELKHENLVGALVDYQNLSLVAERLGRADKAAVYQRLAQEISQKLEVKS